MSAELVSHASVRSSTTASKQFALAFFTDVINKHVQHVDDSNALWKQQLLSLIVQSHWVNSQVHGQQNWQYLTLYKYSRYMSYLTENGL